MKIKKLRGFTIIEMIVAIAFFTIATVGITFVISTSTNMYKTENTKFQTISVADSILNQLKSRGIVEKDAITADDRAPITGLNYFFRNSEDIDKYKYIFLDYTDLSSLTLLQGSYKEDTHYSETDLQNFQSCSTSTSRTYIDSNGISKEYEFVAVVHISRNNGTKTDAITRNYNIDYYYNNYTIDVKVWDLNKDVSSEAQESTAISR
ncbi:type II secretion system protein [Clostridium akagii]|uniref:type II secretion system protein n=1 Tax=Clostridium akagii TaxID=91623 RepID=UPI00047BB230|nr:hypothetical protein [Clostridium akagii]